jgi:nucleoid-associated protein YgaU
VERARRPGPGRPTVREAARGWGVLIAWLAALLVGVLAFHAMGSGPLAAPPIADPGGWGVWVSEREPLVATVAVLRLVVLALAWYLVGVTTIGIVARLTRAARLVRLADALTVPTVRRLLQGALGLGLATAMVGAAAPVHRVAAPSEAGVAAAQARAEVTAGAGEDLRPQEVFPRTRADEVRLTRAVEEDPRSPVDGWPRLVRVDTPAGAGAAPLPLELLDGDRDGDEVHLRRVVEEGSPSPDASTSPVGVRTDHEVVAGESLWTIARGVLAASSAAAADEATLHGYWQALIERNRDRLADPDNPDLIFPGQRLELPPLPGSEGGP